MKHLQLDVFNTTTLPQQFEHKYLNICNSAILVFFGCMNSAVYLL